jgi:Zn-dependent oligopeptidase
MLKKGHIMHGLCSEGEGNSTSLAKCPRDFVEAPSQMLENWCWDLNTIRRLSKHYQNGSVIPEQLIESMLRARNVHAALSMSRQVYLAMLDMSLHGESPPKTAQDIQELVDFLRVEVSGINNPPGCNMLKNFGKKK